MDVSVEMSVQILDVQEGRMQKCPNLKGLKVETEAEA